MKIVIAPDSFKGSLSAIEVANSIEKGIKKVLKDTEIVKIPMADGGEGTVKSLVGCTGGTIINKKVKGPLLNDVQAFYGILGDKKTAVIEMASASGIALIKKDERNPLKTTTYGTGQLIKHALDFGCKKIIVGIGGSATNDAGAGMLQALGVLLLDKDGNKIGFGGGSLDKLYSIDLNNIDSRIKDTEIIVACDVDNPLVGQKGASYVFGAQKGATKQMIEILDKNLEHFAEVVKRELNISIKYYPGAGAAGGLGGTLYAFLNAELRRGIDIVIEVSNFREKIKGSDIVITGEGMMDYQTKFGKTPYGVAKIAKEYNIPVIGICGSIGRNIKDLYDNGFDSIFSIVDKPMNLEESIKNTPRLLENAAERIMRVIKYC